MDNMIFEESVLDEYVTAEFTLRQLIYLANVLLLYINSDVSGDGGELVELYDVIFSSIEPYGKLEQ